MEAGGIYLRQGGELVQMTEQPYGSELELQTLLADYPDLLAADQGDGESRRWLLLAREPAVSDGEHTARWAADHLFVDQDVIPTIVEVKRSDDTRIRREVVGQMLEYAANAVAYWRLDELRAKFEADARADGKDADALLAELLDGEHDPDRFWDQLRANLEASRLRLVFVADRIPPELRRLVEFLNEQMRTAEVLAIEVKQYIDSDGHHQTLVPRLLGQTEKARQAKGRTPAGRWNRDRLMRELEERNGSGAAEVAGRILEWSEKRGLRAWFGRGQQDGSLTAGFEEGIGCYPFSLYTYGRVEVQFQALSRRPPFDEPEMREALRTRLNGIGDAVSLPVDGLDRRPSFPLSVLEDSSHLQAFLDAMDWVFSEVRQAMDAAHARSQPPGDQGA
jgi:hypothetical protein